MWSLLGLFLVVYLIFIFCKSWKEAGERLEARGLSVTIKKRGEAPKAPQMVPGNGRHLQFNYVDVNHDWSKRSVKLQNVSKRRDGLIYLQAFCELRDEERTFRADRIQGDIVDLATGEVLSAHKLLTG